MKKRQYIIIAGIAIFLASIFGMKYISSLKESSARKAPPAAVRSVAFVDVKNDTIQARIAVTGKTVAKDRIDIFAEVSGNLLPSSSKFKIGNSYGKGENLLAIENSEMQLSLQGAKSNFLSVLTRILPDLKLDYPTAFELWQNYTDNFSISGPLAPLPEIKGKEKYFLSSQGVLNQYYTIKSQEVRLAKYTISAPYAGIVSESNINPGTLVRAGQKLGSFIKTGVFEIEFPVDLNHLPFIKIGSKAALTSNQIKGEFEGKVTRISNALDATTQSAKVIVEIIDDRIKEGMYLTGAILTKEFPGAFILAKNQINSQNEAFVILNGELKSVDVKALFVGENEVVTNQLKDGDKILQTVFDGAFSGARVQIEGEKTTEPLKETEKTEE
ncbi:MAG: HlyD family efflux transporter periplasmic adaptor subunit [Bacteroidia bacterium]